MDKTDLTIERNALASLLLTLILVVVIVWMSAMGMVRIENNTAQVIQSGKVIDALHELFQHLDELESGERGYIITGEAAYLKPYEHGLAMVKQQRTELARLLADEPAAQDKLVDLARHLDALLAITQGDIQARQRSFESVRQRILRGEAKTEMDGLRGILDQMSAAQSTRRDELRRQRAEMLEDQEDYIILAAIVSVIVLIYLHLRLMRMMKLRHEAEHHMHHLATHDVLTGLPNRRLLLEHLELAMQRSARNRKGVALLFIDLNGFKPINDSHGHKAGDEVLKQVAQRLSAAMRASDRVARFGGDEFVVLVEDIADKEDVCGVVGKVDEAIWRPILLKQGVEVTVSASIGVAIHPQDGQDVEALLRNADTAMYEAKKTASNCYCKRQTQLRRCVMRQ